MNLNTAVSLSFRIDLSDHKYLSLFIIHECELITRLLEIMKYEIEGSFIVEGSR